MIPDINATKIISDVTGSIDKATANQQSERLKIDTTSPFKLPHLIRPISLIFSGIIWGISILWTLVLATILIMKVGIEQASDLMLSSDSIIMYILAAATTNYGTQSGFYFDSRKKEKISLKNANAAIKIKRLETKAEIKREERDAKKAERNRSYTN